MSSTILKAALIVLASTIAAQAAPFDPAKTSRDVEISELQKRAPKAPRRIWSNNWDPSLTADERETIDQDKRARKAFKRVKKSYWAPKMNSLLEPRGGY